MNFFLLKEILYKMKLEKLLELKYVVTFNNSSNLTLGLNCCCEMTGIQFC